MPAGRGHQLSEGRLAWGMYLEQAEARTPQYGVYSTSFAVQLLSRLSSREEAVVRAIDSGIEFLISQYLEHKAVVEGRPEDGKQARKRKEVGHTDFALVLKYALALEAVACLARLKDVDWRYNETLERIEHVAEQMRRDLAGFARSIDHPAARRKYTGWPWHDIGDVAVADPLDPIPTAYAYRALLSALFRGRADVVVAADVERYLKAVLDEERVRPVEKAVVLNLMDSAGVRLLPSEPNRLRDEIREGLVDETAATWHEVYHYEVSAGGERSHYKPWIWLSPRLELAQAYLVLAPGDLRFDVVAVAHEVIRSVERYGAFRTSLARPPALQASWRAADFLEAVAKSARQGSLRQQLLANVYFLFCGVRRLYYRYIVHPANVLSVLVLAAWALLGPVHISDISAMRIGIFTLGQVGIILGVSILAGVVHALGEDRGDRLRKGVTGTIFALITNCLATYIMNAGPARSSAP